jgi:CRP-like cAMP-binding protein
LTVTGTSFPIPLSRYQLGETLGMSIATVNRTLKDLRASRVMEFQHGKLTVKNWDGLMELGQFDPQYLHLKKPV